MAEHSHAAESHGHGHHVTPPHYYFFNLLALAAFMTLTIYASHVDFGATWINNVVALAIAITKMMLVIMIFMGVKWQTRLVKLWAATGFVWFMLMGIVFGDYFTRDWEHVPGWTHERPYPLVGKGNKVEVPTGGDHGGGH